MTVAVEVGKAKICGVAKEKKGRQDETQFTTKIDGFLTPLNANVLFCRFVFGDSLTRV
jgi:hypothetical protein